MKWEVPADPADSQSFIYVNVERSSDDDSWVTEDSDYISDFAEPAWEEDPSFACREEEAARSGLKVLKRSSRGGHYPPWGACPRPAIR